MQSQLPSICIDFSPVHFIMSTSRILYMQLDTQNLWETRICENEYHQQQQEEFCNIKASTTCYLETSPAEFYFTRTCFTANQQ